VGDALERCALCVWVLWRVEPVLFWLAGIVRCRLVGFEPVVVWLPPRCVFRVNKA
jgi:hypothetical protein